MLYYKIAGSFTGEIHFDLYQSIALSMKPSIAHLQEESSYFKLISGLGPHVQVGPNENPKM